jgi:diphthamide synthase (EF-2-diphthine--ammonia ligase)
LSPDFLGRSFDTAFLTDLPPEVDPCGERGEFQTFVVDHPRFSSGLGLTVGDRFVDGDHALLELRLT